eukprot:SAG11_NODE_2484_length_3303_cov_14.286517_2_plen_119_part_00
MLVDAVNPPKSDGSKAAMGFGTKLLCGGSAGAMASMTGVPSEVVLVRLELVGSLRVQTKRRTESHSQRSLTTTDYGANITGGCTQVRMAADNKLPTGDPVPPHINLRRSSVEHSRVLR